VTSPRPGHRDVAAYALGILDERETAEFEVHLAGCARCAAELDEFTVVTQALADVDVDSLVAAIRVHDDGDLLERTLNAITYRRSKRQARRLVTLAAGALLVVAIVLGGVALGSRSGSTLPRADGATRPATLLTGDPIAPGVRSRPLGESFRARNPATGTDATVTVDGRKWGTALTLDLANVRGPLTCSLLVRTKDGRSEVAMTWTVDPDGYGTAEQPEHLVIAGATSLPRTDIDQFEIYATGLAAPKGGNGILVAIPV
jgi:hypothetical protein